MSDDPNDSFLPALWEKAAAEAVRRGVSKEHVATTMVAVGLRLWVEAVGAGNVAAELDSLADGIFDAIRQTPEISAH